MSTTAPRSLLAPHGRMPVLPALGLALLFHLVMFGAAVYLPQLFDRAHPPRKPIIAHLVALGRPRDPKLLPRKESAPPIAASTPAPVKIPSTKAPSVPATAQKREPTRSELMERALAHAAGRTEPDNREQDPERAGSATGAAEGTAATAEEGDAYFTAVHDAILEHYVVPSVISERERLYLSATVLAWIGADGRILRYQFDKKSGNAFFDQALELAIQKTTLPAPPADLARAMRDTGVALNFRP